MLPAVQKNRKILEIQKKKQKKTMQKKNTLR